MGKGKRIKGNFPVGHRHKGGRSFRSGAQAEAYVNRLKADALRQFDQTRGDYVEAVMETAMLAAHTTFGAGALRLERFYRETIRPRVDAINACRNGGAYEVAETSHNAEDFGIREELRKIGVDIHLWESQVAYVTEDGVRRVYFPGEDGYEAAKAKEAEEA